MSCRIPILVAVATSYGLLAAARGISAAADGTFITTWGSKGTERGQFASWHGMTIDSGGRIDILDFGNEGFVQCYAYPPVSVRPVSLSRLKSFYR